MDGAGADGGATPRFAAYGASKRGLVQLGKSLQVRIFTTPVWLKTWQCTAHRTFATLSCLQPIAFSYTSMWLRDLAMHSTQQTCHSLVFAARAVVSKCRNSGRSVLAIPGPNGPALLHLPCPALPCPTLPCPALLEQNIAVSLSQKTVVAEAAVIVLCLLIRQSEA